MFEFNYKQQEPKQIKKVPHLYMAYGSNLNKEQMKLRCPHAVEKGLIMLPKYRLVFKGVADCIPDKNKSTPIGLWEITNDCEERLDRYEGFPRLYRKEFFKNKDGQTFMMYVMNRHSIAEPNQHYYKCIEQGYKDFSADLKYLEEALLHSYQNGTDGGHIPKRYKL